MPASNRRGRRTTATTTTSNTGPRWLTGLHSAYSTACQAIAGSGLPQTTIKSATKDIDAAFAAVGSAMALAHFSGGGNTIATDATPAPASRNRNASTRRAGTGARQRSASTGGSPTLSNAILAVMPDTRPISVDSLVAELQKRYPQATWRKNHIQNSLNKLGAANKLAVTPNGMWSIPNVQGLRTGTNG